MLTKAVDYIHDNFNELNKITKTINVPTANSDEEIKLFSNEKSDKFIIESNVDRKIENIRQIISTLEHIQNYFWNKGGFNESNLSNDENSTNNDIFNNSAPKKLFNVLRSALGVSQRRSWMIDLKIEDMFRLDPINTDEFILS